MKKLISALAVVAAVTVAPAQAALFSLSAPNVRTTAVAGATLVDFNDGTDGAYASSTGVAYFIGNNPTAAQPKGDTTQYVSISGGAASYVLPTFSQYFGLYWGSADENNRISFYNDDTLVASFTGNDIFSFYANGSRTSDGANRYVNFSFSASEAFNKVRLSYAHSAFETDDHAFVAVPAPAAVGLLGLGLLGFCAARRRAR